MNKNLLFRQLFDHETWTYTYLLADSVSREAILIDTVKEQVSRDLKLLQELKLQLKYVVETHIHADHVTGASDLRADTGAKTVVNKAAGVSCVDIPIEDGAKIKFGNFELRAITTPGHTNTCMCYSLEGMVFTGDVLLIRDVGRTDFQQGSSEKMYESITQKLFTLPKDTLVYPAHDYRGQEVSSIGEEMEFNIKLGAGKSKETFMRLMSEMKLANPKRIHIAVPANLQCGKTEPGA